MHQQRRCIVCRVSGAKNGLLRFVVEDGSLVWDREMKMPGRGAYIHRRLACWARMTERKLWEHALRLPKGLQLDGISAAREAAEIEVVELQVMPEEAAQQSGRNRKSLKGSKGRAKLVRL